MPSPAPSTATSQDLLSLIGTGGSTATLRVLPIEAPEVELEAL